MNLRIGNTTIEITSCVRMRDVKRGFYLDIKIPKDNSSMDALIDLLDGNEETIYVTDAAGNESAYNGFKMLSNLSLENGVYQVCQVCTSEIEAQLSIAQNKIAEQATALEVANRTIAEQAQAISDQNTAISEQAQQLTQQGETIAAQTEQVMVLEATTAEQMLTLDSLLLNVIPAVITDVVVAAVAEALASNPSTDNVEE